MILNIPSLVTRRPFLCLALSLLLAFPFLLQLPNVQTVDNVDYFTIEDDPDVAFYKTIKDTFAEFERNILRERQREGVEKATTANMP